MITTERFKEITGYEPENDDLDRCNCTEAGNLGHGDCGWCAEHNQPVFMCSCPFGKATLAPIN